MFAPALWEGLMAQIDAQTRVLEEWFRLPESRRRHATDAVAFAYRLIQDQPDLLSDSGHETIVHWLAPYVAQGERKLNVNC